MDSVFEQAFVLVIGNEGGYTTNPQDPGNWTGGRIGAGTLKGTKFGISAAAFPTLDIAGLTLAEARSIYLSLFWTRVRADAMPAPLALLMFDAAVNNGPKNAARFLQRALRVPDDGVLGPGTMAALALAMRAPGPVEICVRLQAERLVFMTELPTWRTFGTGWASRLCRLPFQALSLRLPASSGAPSHACDGNPSTGPAAGAA